MDLLNRYPKGYLLRPSGNDPYAGGTKVTDMDEDTVTANLWKIYSANGGDWRKWDFKRAVVAHAAKMYGNFYYWLRLQYVENDCCYDTNLDFLEDTILFIRTGKRRMGLSNWAELLQEYPDAQPGVARLARFHAAKLTTPQEFENVISDWCAWPEGFDDMIATMFLMFGTPRTVLETKLKIPA